MYKCQKGEQKEHDPKEGGAIAVQLPILKIFYAVAYVV
jgi:hypothetical protein